MKESKHRTKEKEDGKSSILRVMMEKERDDYLSGCWVLVVGC